MPVSGGKPKDDDRKVTRVRPVHDWAEVVNLPYDGKRPALPRSRQIVTRKSELIDLPLCRMTKNWWRVISTMPHCRLWTLADWQFALATAIVADQAFRGSSPHQAELRQRERIMGTTLDALRDLRIRYVDPVMPEVADEDAVSDGGTVHYLEDRRDRLTGDDAP